jgi:transcriptional regulator with XRE-family HTH domain
MEKIEHLNWALAKAMRDCREAKGLTQGQLAGFAGLSEIYLSQLERGERVISLHTLIHMCRVLSIPASELVRRIEEELIRGPQMPTRTQGRPKKIRHSDSL